MAQKVLSILPYIPAQLLQNQVSHVQPTTSQTPFVESLQGAVLFADISGFTPLTEALAAKGDEGPEEITRLLNHAFRQLIAALEAEGGDVVKFGGDAITVLFTGAEPLSHLLRRAYQAGNALQRVMQALNPLQSSIGPVELGLKVGIGGGDILAMQLGGMYQHWEYAIAGPGLTQATLAEGQAERGDVCISPEAQTLLYPHPLPPRPLFRADLQASSDQLPALLRRFVPETVLSWGGEADLHQWLGVLRSMSVLFIGLGSFQGEESITALHQFMRHAQTVVARYQGHINKLAIDDKGTIMLMMFGAPPFAHVDDPLRAVRCGLELQQIATTQALTLKIGIATGRVFAGPVGSDSRREYTAMGDTVNLAARLMGKSEDILCDPETHRLTQKYIEYTSHSPVKLKGKAQPLPVYRPLYLSQLEREDFHTPMIGRQDELQRLTQYIEHVTQGHNHIVLLKGDAGIGKTRLLHAFKTQCQAHHLTWLQGSGQNIEQQTSYWVWRDVLQDLFGLHEESQKTTRIQHIIEQYIPEDIELLPLLNALLEVSFPETERTQVFDTALRKQNLHQMLIRLLKSFGHTHPCCVVLENLQWLDSLSWELLHELAWSLDIAPTGIMLVTTVRPHDPSCKQDALQHIESLAHIETIQPLSQDEQRALLASNLELPIGAIPETLCQLVETRAEGNPLFTEELLRLLRKEELLHISDLDGDKRCTLAPSFDIKNVTLPDSLEGLLLARIDQLPPERQLTLRVASVIGRSFSFPLLHKAIITHTHIDQDTLHVLLANLEKDAFTLEESDDQTHFAFKNMIIQEVSYRSLLYQQRRQLHRTIAEHLEHLYKQAADHTEGVWLPLLTYHWHHADDPSREQHYTKLTGQYAARQYANEEALAYFSRSIELTPPTASEELLSLHLERERVYDLLGKREEQRAALKTLRQLAKQLPPPKQIEVALRRLNYALTNHGYSHAIEEAQQIIEQATSINDLTSTAKALQQWGWTLRLQGNGEAAKQKLEEALALAEQANAPSVKAACLRHLGICYSDLHQLDEAIRCTDEALQICTALEQKLDVAGLRNNVGTLLLERDDFVAATAQFRSSWETFQTLGSRRGSCVSLSNLGYCLLKCGQFTEAIPALEQVVRISQEINDKATQSYGLSTLGECHLRMGNHQQAQEILQRALELSRSIGHLYFEGHALCLLSETLFYRRQFDDAQSTLQHAFTCIETLDEKEMRATALLTQGHLQAAQNEPVNALATYKQAAEIFLSIPRYGEYFAALAGQARVHLSQAQSQQAHTLLQSILQSEHNEHIQYANEHFWIELTCIQIQSTQDKAESQRRLEQVFQALQEQAKGIDIEKWRHNFLHNIPAHKLLCQLGPLDETRE